MPDVAISCCRPCARKTSQPKPAADLWCSWSASLFRGSRPRPEQHDRGLRARHCPLQEV